MRKYIYTILILLFASKAFSHSSHYKGLKKIEMDVLRNGEVIGYSKYFFESAENKMTVKNYTKFKVKLLGVTVFSVSFSKLTPKTEFLYGPKATRAESIIFVQVLMSELLSHIPCWTLIFRLLLIIFSYMFVE